MSPLLSCESVARVALLACMHSCCTSLKAQRSSPSYICGISYAAPTFLVSARLLLGLLVA